MTSLWMSVHRISRTGLRNCRPLVVRQSVNILLIKKLCTLKSEENHPPAMVRQSDESLSDCSLWPVHLHS